MDVGQAPRDPAPIPYLSTTERATEKGLPFGSPFDYLYLLDALRSFVICSLPPSHNRNRANSQHQQPHNQHPPFGEGGNGFNA